MLEKKIIYLQEELKENYKPKKNRLCSPARTLCNVIPFCSKKPSNSPLDLKKQTDALLAFVQIYKTQQFVRKQDLYKNGWRRFYGFKGIGKESHFLNYMIERLVVWEKYEDVVVDKFDLTKKSNYRTCFY